MAKVAREVYLISKYKIEGHRLYKKLDEELGVEFVVDRVIEARGKGRVEELILSGGGRLRVNMVVSALGPYPEILPPLVAGSGYRYSIVAGAFIPARREGLETSNVGVYVAGSVAGDYGASQAYASGLLAGTAAAKSLLVGVSEEELEEAVKEYTRLGGGDILNEDRKPPTDVVVKDPVAWITDRVRSLQFIDLCNDVTVEDLIRSWRMGFRDLEKIKRFTALGTGAEQGRYSMQTAAQILSMIFKYPINKIGFHRSRPPLMLPRLEEFDVENIELI